MKFATVALLAPIAFGAGQAQAATSAAFDLLCDGGDGANLHFRFDLAQKKWCSGQCQSVWFIDEVHDSEIKFTMITNDRKSRWTVSINRYTSTFSAVHAGYGDDPADQGTCKAGPFSGFPNRKF